MVVFQVKKKEKQTPKKKKNGEAYLHVFIWNIVNALLPIMRLSKTVLYSLVLFVPISHLIINTLRARRDTVTFVSLLIYT